jgi:FKBP-type peptidyl-prolyl cis-trans isomerase SlyD
MTQEVIEIGKYVSLTYSISDRDGNVLEQYDLPVGFVYGSETELIGGMDRAIRGKCAGDSVEIEVPPEQGFGARDPSLTFTDDIENVPLQFRQIGAEVQMQNESGEAKTFYVTKIENGRLTVDGNHPLAGRHVILRVRIMEVRDAHPGEEMTSGVYGGVSGSESIH